MTVSGLGVEAKARLAAIKLLHTAVWGFFAGCIVALPFAAWRGAYCWAAVLSALVWLECGVLAVNRWRCPLTDLAAKYTAERWPNFDIYLPRWLARHNKMIFGALFVVNEAIVLLKWFRWR
jgi:hypothetical protein